MKKNKKPRKKSAAKRPGKKIPVKYVLNLYVAGLSPRSQKAIDNIKKLRDEYLPGQCELIIQDIYKNPIIARDSQILAVPTLVKNLPLPLRQFVGDMSDFNKLLVGLDLKVRD